MQNMIALAVDGIKQFFIGFWYNSANVGRLDGTNKPQRSLRPLCVVLRFLFTPLFVFLFSLWLLLPINA